MVNRYKQRLTLLQQDILELLFKRVGLELNQNQIAKALCVSPTGVMKSLPLLEKSNYIILCKDKETKRWAIELNRSNKKVIQLKRTDNLKQIYLSGFFDFLEKKFAGGTLILFGSYSRGDDLVNSDIDIAVIGLKRKTLNLEQFEKRLERKINLNFYDSFSKIHDNLKENLANGIILAGGFEL